MLENLKIDNSVEEEGDVIPGSGPLILDTGLYPMIIKMAYLGQSRGGAGSLTLHLQQANDASAPIMKHTLYVTSGNAKGNKNYYVTQEGKKRLLPGMVVGEHLAQITAGKSLADTKTEKKVVKIWDYDSQSEKPTEVPALTEMLDQPVLLGIIKKRENKRASDGAGGWENTNEEKFTNEIDKVFYPDGFTVTERKGGAEEAKYVHRWKDRFPEDHINDKYKPVNEPGIQAPSADATGEGGDDLPFDSSEESAKADQAVSSLFS